MGGLEVCPKEVEDPESGDLRGTQEGDDGSSWRCNGAQSRTQTRQEEDGPRSGGWRPQSSLVHAPEQ